MNNRYISPEFEFYRIRLLRDVLSTSTANHDYNDLGGGGGLFDDSTNPDINNDYYEFGDGDW